VPRAPNGPGLDEMLEQWLIENPVASVDPQRTARTVRTMVEAATSGRRVGLERKAFSTATSPKSSSRTDADDGLGGP